MKYFVGTSTKFRFRHRMEWCLASDSALKAESIARTKVLKFGGEPVMYVIECETSHPHEDVFECFNCECLDRIDL